MLLKTQQEAGCTVVRISISSRTTLEVASAMTCCLVSRSCQQEMPGVELGSPLQLDLWQLQQLEFLTQCVEPCQAFNTEHLACTSKGSVVED